MPCFAFSMQDCSVFCTLPPQLEQVIRSHLCSLGALDRVLPGEVPATDPSINILFVVGQGTEFSAELHVCIQSSQLFNKLIFPISLPRLVSLRLFNEFCKCRCFAERVQCYSATVVTGSKLKHLGKGLGFFFLKVCQFQQ